MPLAKRIIPCLDVDNGRVVKGVHFTKVKDAGDPVEFAEKYSQQGADELIFLDITASQQGRETMKNVVRNVASVIDIPFTVGGGIKRLEDARDILLSGADKVSINTAAVKDPQLIIKLTSIFGRQCIVIAIDAKRNYCIGEEGTGIDAIEWAKRVESLGAGEILLTSIDADGTENGYDIKLNKTICLTSRIPIIASGGCGHPEHMLDVFKNTEVDAALAASIFHYEKSSVDKVKEYLNKNGIKIRM
jgi:cyclase